MRTRIWLPMVLALVPAVAAAQGRQGMGRRPGMQRAPQLMQRGMGAGLEGGPAQMLLDRKEELGLSAEQVTRLEGLAGEWEAAHEPVRAEMEQMRQNRAQITAEQRQQMEEIRTRARAAGESARAGIEGILTAEQKQMLGNRAGRAGMGQGRQAIRRGNRGGIGGGALGPARGPGVAPRAQLGRGPQALAPRFRAQTFQRRGLVASRLQLQRRGPALAAPLMGRRWMDPDTTR